MSTEQERSFIASIRCEQTTMKFFGQMFANANVTSNLLTTHHQYSQTSEKMIQVRKKRDITARTLSDDIIVYFRCYDDYYNIQVRSQPFLGQYLSKDYERMLGAFPGAGGSTTSFNLLNLDHEIITLDDIDKNSATVHLKARNAGIIKRQLANNPKVYTYGDNAGELVTFNLTILERNVPYPSSTEPYPLYIEPRAQFDDDD